MAYPNPAEVERVALIGAGTIGGGWAAHFLRQGLEVVVYDPDPAAESHLRQTIADVWPTLERLGLRPSADPNRLSFAADITSVVEGAHFVQESTPEREALKVEMFRHIDSATPAGVVIASSTSGVPATVFQRECAHPERCVVGHPFNPPYLIPLVEVVPGERTSKEAADWTVAFYEAMGKKPLKLSKEYPAFLANRLLEAVWRESLHLIAEGLATVEEIDTAMSYAPALRWAIMGPCLTYHLGGGRGGMRHFLDQFGPTLELPWSYMDGPELTPELHQRLVEGSEQAAAGRSIRELERERDDCLIAILGALEECRAVKHGGEA